MMDTPILLILRGLPASGKTTFARKWVNKDPKNRVRINRDDIRRQLGPYWVPQREALVTQIEWASLTKSLGMGYSVVLDATNFRLKTKEQVIENIQKYDPSLHLPVKIEILDCILPLEECIRRDKERENPVGEKAITRMYNKYLK